MPIICFFSFCPVPQTSCILCSENASSFSENRRSTLTTKIEKNSRSSKNMRRCQKKKEKLLVYPPSAATWLKVLTVGGSRYQSVGAARRGCSVAGEDESHCLTTLSSGSDHSAPGKTYPDVVLPGSPSSHADTHLRATHGLHIMEGWFLSSHFFTYPHLFAYCTSAEASHQNGAFTAI